MSQEKAQLIAPIDSSFTVPGVTVSGVITATSFDGTITGVADSITQGKNLNVGVVTALSFAGNLTGDAGGLIGSPNTVAGVVTANSFVGGITGNITGDVIGNATGVGASIKQGVNLNVGIATASTWYGDGAGLTGLGGTSWIAQEVTPTGDETIIDLTYGNLIYYKGGPDSTVGFASTAGTQEVSLIRDTAATVNTAYNDSFSTGGVEFDGNDYLSIADNAAFQFGTGDFTVEWFWKGSSGSGNYQQIVGTQSVFAANSGIWRIGTKTSGNQIYFSSPDGSGFDEPVWNVNVNDDSWHHIAITRESSYVYCYVDGVKQTNVGESNHITRSLTTSNTLYIGYNGRDTTYVDGIISNLRIVKGTAVYTDTFLPPSTALTNVTNTVLLCCQSDSSATASTVSAGTISQAGGSPTAASRTVAYSGTNTIANGSITWPDRITWSGGSAPTSVTNARTGSLQVIRLLSADSGLTYSGWEEMKEDKGSTLSLMIWGAGSWGRQGMNDLTDRSSPIQVGTDTTWSKTARGDMHNNNGGAIKTDGTLWTWGQNEYGMLGHDTNDVNVSSPTQVGTDTTWNEIAMGHDITSIATKTDGTLWVWGNNNNGILGQNQLYPAINAASSPTQVPGTWETGRYSITSHAYGVAAIKNGKLFMWGYNGLGALGLNGPINSYRSSPTQVGTDMNWASLSGSYYSMTAIKTNGTLWTWGNNSEGKLGHNQASTQYSSPTQIPGTDWKQSTIANYFAGAVKTNGELWVWGNGIQLGVNNNTSRSSPIQVPGTTWNAVTTSDSVMLATKTDGTLWSWGENYSGSLGVNVNNNRSSPMQIPGTWNTTQLLNARRGFAALSED